MTLKELVYNIIEEAPHGLTKVEIRSAVRRILMPNDTTNIDLAHRALRSPVSSNDVRYLEVIRGTGKATRTRLYFATAKRRDTQPRP